MEWWREARFGMFIHWGLYAIPAGEWKDKTTHAEWIRTTAQIPLKEYDQFVPQFNPDQFNAKAWVQMAKDAGMNTSPSPASTTMDFVYGIQKKQTLM